MFDSKEITSPQTKPHKRLCEVVGKHVENTYKKPFQDHNLIAFKKLQKAIESKEHNAFILDSCCGTGMSTSLLAEMHPESLVIGIDRSAKRLEKKPNDFFEKRDNCIYLQGNCEDIWRLCVEHNITFEMHYILYPNPYPKAEHLKRRWHGHPVFPFLQHLAPKTILRSNWRLYLEEFSIAWAAINQSETEEVSTLEVTTPLTLFERKYLASGQPLYELHNHSRHFTTVV